MTEHDEILSALATATRPPGELRPRPDTAVLVRTRARRRRRRVAALATVGLAGCLALVAVVATEPIKSRTTGPASGSTPTATSPTATTAPSTAPTHVVMWPPGPRTFAVPIHVQPVKEEFPDGLCPGDDGTVAAASGTGCFQLGGAAMEISRVRDLSLAPATGPQGTVADDVQVMLVLTASDARAWASLTERSVGKQVALVVDGRVYYAPTVAERISGGLIAMSLARAATESLAEALGISTGQTDSSLVPDSALARLNAGIVNLTQIGETRPVSARLVTYQVYRWGSPDDFTLLVTIDLHFPTKNTMAWQEGTNTRFVTFTKEPGNTSYRLAWTTSP